MSAFSVENPHDGKTFENYTRFEWGVEVGVVTTFILRLFVPHEFDMIIYLFASLFTYRKQKHNFQHTVCEQSARILCCYLLKLRVCSCYTMINYSRVNTSTKTSGQLSRRSCHKLRTELNFHPLIYGVYNFDLFYKLRKRGQEHIYYIFIVE